ncbi:MAG: epoxyqueuosine reductase [Spirochaetales bacterium]|nr:epoxyqueuosine reductase [Spirochaetales bacterium]
MRHAPGQDESFLARLKEALETRGFYEIRTLPLKEVRLRLEEIPGDWGIPPALTGRGTLLMAAFPYTRPGEGSDASQPGDPHGLIAPFARRHYYQEAVTRMKGCLMDLGRQDKDVRLFSNSRLPEKPLAAAAGLGFYGRNGLLIVPGLGSRFILAGMMLPLSIGEASHPPLTDEPGAFCGSCRLCIDACPTGALDGFGNLDKNRCLQAWATEDTVLPDTLKNLWGKRLYGCEACQEPCPYNNAPIPDDPPITGELGSSVSIRLILEKGREGSLKSILKGTALGMAWMKPEVFIRNALLSAASAGEKALSDAARPYLHHKNRTLSETARQVMAALDSSD